MSEPRDLESLYAQARAAIAAREYDRASELLKQIVAQDENYKDAARLLAGLVARSRRRWYNDARLWSAVGVIILIAFGIFIAQQLSSLLPARAAETPTVVALAPTATATRIEPNTAPALVPSVTPMRAATAVPLVWKRISMGQEFPRDQINAIIVDPRDSEVIYLATASAGIFKSVDGGISWQPAYKGSAPVGGGYIFIDPKDSRVLYIGLGFSGVYRTLDGGELWESISQGIEQRPADERKPVYSFAVDPQNSRHQYYVNMRDKLYETNDGGRSWKQIRNSPCPSLWEVAVHPSESNVVFAAGVEEMGCKGGLYRSNDGGKTWTLLQAINNSTSGFIRIDRTGKFIYNIADQLYGSTDGGYTWKISRQLSINNNALAFHPDTGAIVYGADWDNSFIKTIDGGQTWQAISKLNITNPYAIAMLPHDVFLLGGVGVFVSTDGGRSWVERSNGIGIANIHLQLSPDESTILYAGEMGCTGISNKPLYRSTDGGRTWQFVSDRGCGLAIDPSRNMLFRISRSGDNAQAQSSKDGGKTFTRGDRIFTGVPGDAGAPRDYSIAANPSGKSILLYVNQQPYVFISSDGGVTWENTTGIAQITGARFFFGYDQGQTVYAFGQGSYRSNDGGKTWVACAPVDYGSPRTNSKLAIDPRNSNHVLLGTSGGGVLVSQDGCQSWQPSRAGMENLFVKSVAIDPKNPDRVYAGTDGGAYVSFDGGKNWNAINDGLLGALVIYSIVIDPRDSAVYASTPYGIFKLESK